MHRYCTHRMESPSHLRLPSPATANGRPKHVDRVLATITAIGAAGTDVGQSYPTSRITISSPPSYTARRAYVPVYRQILDSDVPGAKRKELIDECQRDGVKVFLAEECFSVEGWLSDVSQEVHRLVGELRQIEQSPPIHWETTPLCCGAVSHPTTDIDRSD